MDEVAINSTIRDSNFSNNLISNNSTALSTSTFPSPGILAIDSTFIPPWTEEQQKQKERTDFFIFVTYGILLNAFAILGIFGNIISMIILSRPQLKSSMNYLLMELLRSDTLLILTSMFLFGLPPVNEYTHFEFLRCFNEKFRPLLTPYILPLASAARTATTYLTLSVTLERYVAVCHPLRAKSLCTYRRARICVTLIIIFSFLCNLVKFWEVKVEKLIPDQENPSVNHTIYVVYASSLRKNNIYKIFYIHWFYFIFIHFLPYSSLTVLNAAIYLQVRRANKQRQKLSKFQQKEIDLAVMLLCVVVIFFLCNFLTLLINFLEIFYDIIIDEMTILGNLLVTINSSVNFIIYVIFSEKFKHLFFKIFCSHCKGLTLRGHESTVLKINEDSDLSNHVRKTYSSTSCSSSGL